MKSINLKKLKITLLKAGILHIHLKANCEITLKDATEGLEAMKKLSGETKMPVFIDAGDYCSIDKDVRAFSASKESNLYTLADAIAYDNIGQKLVANFYLSTNKPVVPTKIFSSKKEALHWLRTFKNNQ